MTNYTEVCSLGIMAMNTETPAVDMSEKARNDGLLRYVIDMDTSSAPPAEQFELFRSWYTGVAESELLEEESPSFFAHQMVWDLGKLTLIHIKLPEWRYCWRHLSKPTIDNWYLTLSLPQFSNPGNDLEVGSLSLQSLLDPFEAVSERHDFLAFFLPRNLHFMRSPKIEIRYHMKRFLTDYMLLLHGLLFDLRSIDVPHIAAATTSLLAACLAPSRDHIAEAQHPIETVIMNRAFEIIERHLDNPKLTPDLLCRELGVSRSNLYRIFEPVGGVSSYIRRERLRKTRNMLANSSDGRSISTIAEQWGFIDPYTYSRMFKKEFGLSPREARAESCLSVKFSRPADKARTFRDLLIGNYCSSNL